MKAKVYVTLKKGVLDPQGKAIHHSAELMGFSQLADIRQGKYFEISFNNGIGESEVRDAAESIGRDVLANPVIEDFMVEISA